MLGTRFRLHGRCARYGMDCVGLAGHVYGVDVPRGYALRGENLAHIAKAVGRAGLQPVGVPAPGDLLLLRAGAGQMHLAILSDMGLIHADAGLRRVVERPGPSPWPILAHWRYLEV